MALNLYAFLMFTMAVSFPIQIMVTYELSWRQVSSAFSYLTDINYAVMAALAASGVLAFRASRRLLVVAPLTLFLVSANNYWVGYIGLNFSFGQTSLASFGFVVVSCLIFEKRAWYAVRDPKMHWWRTAGRARVRLPIQIHPWVGESISCATIDISESGTYVDCPAAMSAHLKLGDYVQVKIKIDGCVDVRCTAKVMRKCSSAGSRPVGLGLQFSDMTRSQKKLLRRLVPAVAPIQEKWFGWKAA